MVSGCSSCGTSKRRWRLIKPPSWLRHFVSWRMLERINDRYHLCWSGMVMWKLGYGWSWAITQTCFEPYDYCGRYDTPEQQAEALRISAGG